MATYVIYLCLIVVCVNTDDNLNPLSDDFIDRINQKQNLWRAGRNFAKNTSYDFLNKIAGAFSDDPISHQHVTRDLSNYNGVDSHNIPAYFDARKEWPRCHILWTIRDQGGCGSCWAVAVASALSDILCIQRQQYFFFSAEDILNCCTECWAQQNTGCEGGFVEKAWTFAKRVGVVSGGNYNRQIGCRPYNIPPCDHTSLEDCDGSFFIDNSCNKSCDRDYSLKYSKDKRRLTSVLYLDTITKMQINIMKNGPVTTTFQIYCDFFSYKYGIYQYLAGSFWGNHTVKVIGWGEDSGIKYWIAANSWNTTWGDKGFFKIIRGENHLNFERVMYGGIPRRTSN